MYFFRVPTVLFSNCLYLIRTCPLSASPKMEKSKQMFQFQQWIEVKYGHTNTYHLLSSIDFTPHRLWVMVKMVDIINSWLWWGQRPPRRRFKYPPNALETDLKQIFMVPVWQIGPSIRSSTVSTWFLSIFTRYWRCFASKLHIEV